MSAKLTVETQLDELLKGLQAVQKQADDIKMSFQEAGKAAGESVQQQAKQTENFLEKMKGNARSIARTMKEDFRALMSLNAVTDAMKLSNQFRGAIAEVFTLTDSIKKFGTALGINAADFGKLEAQMIRGLGRIGMSSEVASRTLKGLMGTGVKGEAALLDYTLSSGQLASVSKTQGQEGEIAGSMARVLRAQGKDVNDLAAQRELSTQVNRAYQATGKSPEEILKGMESMFSGMADDFRKRFSLQSMTQLAAASQVAGPEATTFLEQYMRMSPIRRMALDQQGMAGVIRADGTLDSDKFGAFARGIKGRVGQDPQLAAETLGISEDAAKGFLRLADNLERVKDAQDAIGKSTRSLADDYRNSMGFGEAFRANINRVKSLLAAPLTALSGGGSNLLQSASESDAGALAVTGGAALGAAALAGWGTRGLGKVLGKGAVGGLAKGAAAEAITGRETIPVYVVNAGEIGSGLSSVLTGGGAPGGGGLKAAAMTGLKVVGAIGATRLAMEGADAMGVDKDAGSKEYLGVRDTFGETAGEGYRQLMNFMGQMVNMLTGTDFKQIPKVQVEVTSRDPGIKATSKGSRGEAQ